jgi:DNA gyrase subunit A
MKSVSFAKDLERSIRAYAIETILDRALPDVRDGLKPVHRRILYAMGEDLGLTHNRPHKKSARVVGEVLGKYHPHGDTSVYDAMVRMAQDFSMRLPLVDGQGNFGSIDGDNAAAMRYTEARLTAAAELMLQDIKADTVAWQPNFDDSLQEPAVLPSVLPNLLLNGSSGIAVAMSTNVPPHNLGELCDALAFVGQNWAKREAITVEELMAIIPGPDFPTGGLAFRYRENGSGGLDDTIHEMYETGYGKLIVQAWIDIEPQGGGKHLIVVSELPYMVQKSTVMERVGTLVREGRIDGIVDVRDESDHEGMRLIIETTRGHDPAKILEGLLTYTQLRETFGANMLALVPTENGIAPQQLSLRQMLVEFIQHRLLVIERRSRHERQKLQDRLHIVDGLLLALDVIDEVIATIKKSRSRETARANLQKEFKLSERQSAAIVAMPLGNLASLEVKKLRDEKKDLSKRIKELTRLIESEKARLAVVAEETAAIKARFSTPRRTRILDSEEQAGTVVTGTDLIEPQIVTILSDDAERRDCQGYADRGMLGLTSRRTPTIIGRWYADPEDRALLVAEDGECWHAPTIQLENGVAKGKRLVGGGILPAAAENYHIVLLTRGGKVKRVHQDDLPRSVASWARLIGLAKGDTVLAAGLDKGAAEVMLFTRQGQGIRFQASSVNPQASATATGVAAIKLVKGDDLLSGAVFDPSVAGFVIVVSENGFVKRVPLTDWPVQGRAGKGVQSLAISKTTGRVSTATVVRDDDNYVDLALNDGRRFRLKLDDIPTDNRRNRGLPLAEEVAAAGLEAVLATGLSSTYTYRGA